MEQHERDVSVTRVDNPEAVAQCLEKLMGPAGASLLLARPGCTGRPVVITAAQPGEWLLVDIGSAREVLAELKRGQSFNLLAHSQGDVLRSCELTMSGYREAGGAIHGFCPYPRAFDILQRRESFRAELRLGMAATVVVTGHNGVQVVGGLKNLSLGGCLAMLPLGAATLIGDGLAPLQLMLQFPDGTSLALRARLRRLDVGSEQGVIQAGLQFDEISAAQDRQLWVLVREVEREAARYLHGESEALQPSPLFIGPPARRETPVAGDRPGNRMMRRLANVAEHLGVQLMTLRRGGGIDSAQLSRHADRLLALLDEDREALLFATAQLHDQPPLFRHCLAVAVRLVDISDQQRPSRALRKAMMASAMVHELGRALLADGDLSAPSVDMPRSRGEQRSAEELMIERLAACRWLSGAVTRSVVRDVNERLDGSGYPRGRTSGELHQLARLMAVVDAVDALGRRRGDGEAMDIAAVYAYLLARDGAYERHWIEAYRQHFGALPVGTLVRYPGGELAWVLRLDDDRQPVEVQLARAGEAPGAGAVVRGRDLAALGAPVAAGLEAAEE
ncbi:MAG: PilZ domain-containing protein [Porticoccaceae bacterium]